jgi:hypothetical protein
LYSFAELSVSINIGSIFFIIENDPVFELQKAGLAHNKKWFGLYSCGHPVKKNTDELFF